MNRRDFIANSSLLGLAAFVPFSCKPTEVTPKFKMGLQLFSINNDMSNDPIGTLGAVKDMGYEDFEIYGFDAENVTYYGLPAQELKNVLDNLGLTVSSGHYGFSEYLLRPLDDMKYFVDQCIKGALALDKTYITWPWIAPELRTIENFKIMSEKLNIIGEQVRSAGLEFAYHNHGYEFEEQNGQTGYDIILKETDPSVVKLQMDMYWVMHAGKTTPKKLIEQQPGRYVMWHIKDMDKTTRDYTELGNGSIDYHNILPDPKTSGLRYYYIEQGGNYAKSAMQSAADSASYFKEQLQQYL